MSTRVRSKRSNKGLGSALARSKTKSKQNAVRAMPSPCSHVGVVVTARNDEVVQEWLDRGRLLLMAHCGSPTAAQLAKAQQKIKDLSTFADVDGISFSGNALHHIYFSTKFKRRGWLTYAMFQAAHAPSSPWQRKLSELLGSLAYQQDAKPMTVCSLGGGPGTDAASLLWVNQHFWRYPSSQPLTVRLLDYEGSWKRHLGVLADMMQPHSVSFTKLDITQSMSQAINHSVAAALQDCRLYLFSYVCHETSRASILSNHVFYHELAQHLRVGDVLLFTDVMEHSRACLEAIKTVVTESCVHAIQPLMGDDGARRLFKAEIMVLKIVTA